MKNIKTIAFLGLGIALYAVLGLIMNIPLLAGTHLQTDLGYIAFSVFLVLFGWKAFIVGAAGCFIEGLITSGWIAYGWILGNVLAGIICGLVYTKKNKKWLHVITTVIGIFAGIALVKTGVECVLFSIPFGVKFPKNLVAFIADTIPALIGLPIGYRMKRLLKKEG